MAKTDDIITSEKEAIQELRNRVKDELTPKNFEDDLLLYRFLKARKFDMNKAEVMLRKHLSFRKAWQVDTLLRDFKPKEVFLKYYQGTNLGEDKEGNQVLYFGMGKMYVSDLVKSFKFYNLMKHLLWLMEGTTNRMNLSNFETGKNEKKITFIFDLEGLELFNVLHPSTPRYLSYMAEHYEFNYPEILKSVFIINAPTYYMIGFSVLKRILVAEIIQKFNNFGNSGWKEELLKVMDADTLPAFLGGNKTDPDGNPRCNTFVRHSGRVSSKYYLSNQEREFRANLRVERVSIPPKNKHEVTVEVKSPGSIIQWEFEVPNKDIGFGLFFKDIENNLKGVLPIFRYDTYNGTEDDTHKCQWTGTYIIIFDNSYSWLTKKELSYCITVHEEV